MNVRWGGGGRGGGGRAGGVGGRGLGAGVGGWGGVWESSGSNQHHLSLCPEMRISRDFPLEDPFLKTPHTTHHPPLQTGSPAAP